MESLPIDLDNPAVKDYLALIRLQVLTPLSLLINISTVLVCSLIVKPSIGGVSRLYPTSISPNPHVIAAYVMAIWIGQVGYCLMLVLATKPETKKTMVKGVGISLVLANWVMASWAISWVLKVFLVSTILQGLLLLLLVYANIVLLVYHAPTSSRPFDTALIHAPLRFFLILPLSLLFPISLFITLHLTHKPGIPEHQNQQWPGFLVVLLSNFLGLLVIILRHDIVWCVAAVWVCVSIWTEGQKHGLIFLTVVVFTVVLPLALLTSMLWSWMFKRRESRGPIALPPDREGEVHTYGATGNGGVDENRGPREVDAEALWS